MNNLFSELLQGNNNPTHGEWTFVSSTHQRYENSYPVMGLQEGHTRIIKIEKNISGQQGYSVTILNSKPNPFSGLISMATKPMIIMNREDNIIELIGYGNDKLSGVPFSHYGLSLYYKNNTTYKVILHMHDRSVDIEYLP